jgi:RND family efflux transporter MFP subunit
VSLPVTREVTDYEDFPGRTEAVYSIDVRARVTGYLNKVYFKEGDQVKEGATLFEIDPRPYEADFDRAAANLVQAEAHVKRLELDFKRAQNLLATGAMGREEFDKVVGDHAEAKAAVGVSKASKKLAQLNLSFTRVLAPISGRISRRYIDPGNLVKADDTILTNIVSLQPMYAYFDLDERTTLRLNRLIRDGKIKWSQDEQLPVYLGCADEENCFPRQGLINFADNKVDPETGTWRVRARFTNADQALTAGLFVRIRLPIGNPYQALLISEQALGTNQGQKFAYVVGKGDVVEQRTVKVGKVQNGLRVVVEGLKKGERVVVSGLQRVREGAKVVPKMVDMPETTVASANGSSH